MIIIRNEVCSMHNAHTTGSPLFCLTRVSGEYLSANMMIHQA